MSVGTRQAGGDIQGREQGPSRPASPVQGRQAADVRAAVSHQPPAVRLRVAYMMSRFPKLTETFVLNEIVAMKREVTAVEIYPLMQEKAAVVHEQALRLAQEAHYTPFISAPILQANVRALRRQRATYRQTLRDVVRETRRNRRFLAAGLALFPKAVYLASVFEARGIDHVHAHFATHPAAAAFIIHRFSGIPFSFTGHGSDLHRFQDMLCLKIREAAFVVTISEYNRRFMMAHCGEAEAQKIRVLHCGVELEEFAVATERGPQPANGETTSMADPPTGAGRRPSILCIGTLHEVKGQRYLLDAVALLREQGLEARCHFVGGGPDREALEHYAERRGIADRVTFFGQRSRRQVIEHLREADVLVAPSVPSSDGRREGIPVVLIEAMASGVPVVASRLSGIPELVRHEETGLLAPPGDAPALAAAIRRLCTEQALAHELTRQAQAYVQAEFNLQRNAAALAQLFAEAAR